MQQLPRRQDYEVEYFNLDAILSVGYRVNSKQGTQFRIWATQTLREHLIRGYTLNEKRLAERGLTEAQQAIELLSKTLTNQALVTDQGRAVLDVVQQYTRAWRLLLEYDENRLAPVPASPVQPSAVDDQPHSQSDRERIVTGESKGAPKLRLGARHTCGLDRQQTPQGYHCGARYRERLRPSQRVECETNRGDER